MDTELPYLLNRAQLVLQLAVRGRGIRLGLALLLERLLHLLLVPPSLLMVLDALKQTQHSKRLSQHTFQELVASKQRAIRRGRTYQPVALHPHIAVLAQVPLVRHPVVDHAAFAAFLPLWLLTPKLHIIGSQTSTIDI